MRGKGTASESLLLTHSAHKDGYLTAEPLVLPSVLRDGAVVSVRDPLWQAACLLSCEGGSGIPEGLREAMHERIGHLESRKKMTTREYVDVTLNDPTSSTAALVIGVVILVLIVVSTITFCLETIPWYYDPEPGYNVFFVIESFCISLFTIEFTARIAVSRNRREFMSNGLNQIDLIAILPFYLELLAKGVAIPGLSVLRVTRLARVFRLLKVSKDSLSLLVETMARSARPLYILGFLLCISLVMFSSILYYAERGSYDLTQGKWMRTVGFNCDYICSPETRKLITPYLECTYDGEARTMFFSRHSFGQFADLCTRVTENTPYQSIMHSLWWAMVTMATVGYGDMYPRSVAGYMLAGTAMLCGILVIALPITVIGSNFSSIYDSLGTNKAMIEGEQTTTAVVARRLHTSGQGATHPPVTQHWLSTLSHEWDLDINHTELLPSKPPVQRRGSSLLQAASSRGSIDMDEYQAFYDGKGLTMKAPKTPQKEPRGKDGVGPPKTPQKEPSGKDAVGPNGGTLKSPAGVKRFEPVLPDRDAEKQRFDALVKIATNLVAESVANHLPKGHGIAQRDVSVVKWVNDDDGGLLTPHRLLP